MTERKPYREAAQELGMGEEALRRKILLGEVDATPVDDDRQYLVTIGKRGRRATAPRVLRLLLWSALAWMILSTVVLFGTATTQERCDRCASIRVCERLLGVPMESVTAIRKRECDHQWRVTWRASLRKQLREHLREVPE